MRILRNKSKIFTTALVLVLTMVVSLFALPAATAQARVNPFPYINAIPNPVKVATPTLLHVGSIYPLPWEMAPGWTGLTVEITKPDTSTEILGPFTTDLTGGTGVQYTPAMVGTYTLRTHFPETRLQPPALADGDLQAQSWKKLIVNHSTLLSYRSR